MIRFVSCATVRYLRCFFPPHSPSPSPSPSLARTRAR
jgi:hypothetical protein